MKRIYFLLVGLSGFLPAIAQPVDLVLSTAESGTQIHLASNSITFAPGYSYTPNGGTMLAEIVSQSISGNITYFPAINPGSYSINTELQVGKTAGSFAAGGNAYYTIPIEVPGGTNSLQPDLSLKYASRFADGILGMGWNLGGISAISRVGKTIYHDGKSDPVRANLTDRYALDGNRLVVVNGSYGTANSEYRTEIEEFAKVVAYGSTGTGPLWFKVYTKSGLIYEYGNTEDSRISNDQGCILSWRVSKITDRYNNYITFSYILADDERPIGKIEYTGNSSTSQDPFAYVKFNYKYRSDVSSYYYGGKEFTRDILLDNIEVQYNGNPYKKYGFTYMRDTYAQLQKVTEYSSQGSALNPTVFAWTDQTEQFTQTTNYSVTADEVYFVADFNGDARDDLVSVPNKTSYTSSDKWKLYLADANGTMVYTAQGDLNTRFETFLVGDFNGDGLTDLMMQENYADAQYPRKKYYYFYSSTGTTFTRGTTYYLCYDSEGLDVVDYNGDGKLEFMYHNTNNNWYLYTYLGASIYSASIPSFGKYYIKNTGMHNRILDFNGDGCSDLLVLFSNGYKVYEFKGNNDILIETYSGTNIQNNDFILFGDFNGDGTTDIIKEGNSSYPEWSILFLTAGGFQEHELNGFDDFDILKVINRIFARDMNGDGKTDVILVGRGRNPGNNYNRINVGLSSGNDFSFTEYVSSTAMQYADVLDWCFNFGDFDGDGRYQLFYKYYSTSKLFSFASGTPSHLLSTVIDGLGAKASLTYLPMSSSNVYTRGTGAAYPVNDFSSSMQLVSQVSADNGIGGTNSVTYRYEGAKTHRQGKGFLGFSKVTATDVTTGILTETQSGYNTNYYYPQINKITKKTTGGVTIGTITNTWTQIVLDANNKRIFPYIESTARKNALTGHADTVITWVVDSYGNPASISKNYSNGAVESIDNSYYEWINTNEWLVGRIGQLSLGWPKIGEPPVPIKSVRYTYSTDGIVKPDYIYYYEGSPLEYYENCDYDNRGNLIRIYTSGASIGASQTSYTYNSKGDKLVTTTDVLGHTTTRTYDDYGRLLTERDYLNNTITYNYDVMDRPYLVSSTAGSQNTTAYVWTGTNKPALAVYGITQSGNNGSVSTIWYDKLQRPIRSIKKGFDGTMILIDTEYNVKGQIYRVSDPYFAGSTVTWGETYTYDDYGRVKNINRNTGRNTVYSYSGATVSETTDGKIFSKTIGPDGTLTSATDNGGNISYTYYPDGKVKTITAPGDIVTSMQYADAAANQTRLVDPSAGTINYTYNSFGRLKTQTNARNQLTTYNYHTDGRINTVITPEGTTTYTYNTNKQLTGISSPGGISRTYVYDSKGRIGSVSETIPGSTALTTTFTYDDKGRLSTITHPSGIIETNNYNTNGYLASVSAGGATRWTTLGMNARNQVTSGRYGTGLNTTFGYNTYGYPASAVTSTLQSYQYDFNAVTGNLNWRKNVLQANIQENFEYDNLERLDRVYRGSTTLLDMTYDGTKGGISLKSDVGTLLYDGQNKPPYALSDVNPSTGLIPEAVQSIDYTSFESISSISEGNYSAAFIYNSDNERARMVVQQSGSDILTRWYAGGSYIKETAGGGTKEYTFIGGDAYTAPVVAVTQGGTTVYYNLLRDYLGSITHVVNASNNTLVAEYSYDAWGRRRNPTTWVNYDPGSEPSLMIAGRGFTGHEHLPWFNLINMNGRCYDPLTGQFISPDNHIQAPDFSQNFNRYSYALNNPLIYTDPDGEWIHIVIGAAIGGVVNLGIKLYQGKVDNFWDGVAAFGIGAAAGAVGAATGGAAFTAAGGAAAGAGGFLAGAAGGMVGSAFAMPIQSIGNTAYFGDPMMTGKQYLLGIGIGTLLGGTTNGAIALFNGKTFWTGDIRGTGITTPGPNPTLKLDDPEVKLNTESLRTKPLSMPDENYYSIRTTTDPQRLYYLEGQDHIRLAVQRPEITGL